MTSAWLNPEGSLEPGRPTPTDLLELDVDLRLWHVLLLAHDHTGWDQRFAALLRLAYGAGYSDALSEPRRGQLCLDHRLRVPQRLPSR